MSDTKAAPLRAEDVLRDVGYPKFVEGLFNRSGDRSKDWTHAVLGISTEITEYLRAIDAENGLEEQGDLRFYGQEAINLTEEFSGLDFDFELSHVHYGELVSRGEVAGTEAAIDEARAEMLDVAKRWVGYDKAPEDILVAGARAVALVQFVTNHGRFHEPDVDKVELVNVAKLLERYKGLKFSSKNAVNRDVKAERRAIEQASS